MLPIAYDDFQEVVEKKNLNFVDKTIFIKEVFDDVVNKVVVITRPRRFGKTFNLSMLHCFLADKIDDRSTSGLFNNLKISSYGDEYMKHQGKYPVVSVTFKDVRASNYKLATLHLYELMSELYIPHQDLLSSQKLSDQHKRNFEKILRKEANEAELMLAIKNLTEYLYLHYGVKPWLLIDEYDTPLQEAYAKGYYDEMIEFMRVMFGAALKTNRYLEKAVITGILRIAKESLFSGVNNLKVYSLLNKKYSEYFGFTESEMNEILKNSNLTQKAEEIKQWYNGYQVGSTVIYNPWSIANCIQENGVLKPYWVNTSENQLVKDLLKKSPLSFKKDFEALVKDESLEKFIDESLTFKYLNNNPNAVWSLLLMAGYLKPISYRETDQGTFAHLEIPNKEVRNLYRQIIEQWLSNGYGIEWYNDFIASLLNGRIDEFENHLEKVILQITSFHDFAKEPEAFYQGLMLGFTVSLHGTGTYEIRSNRESGSGRFDILLIPKDTAKLGVIMELKVGKKNESLIEVAEKALKQIDKKQYIEEMKSRGIKQSIKIGIGFKGKAFKIRHAREPEGTQ